jgi:hypothetical protein
MRKLLTSAALGACALLAACGGGPQPVEVSHQNTNSNANSNANSAQTSIQHGTSPQNLGVAASHGSGATNAGVNSGATQKPSVETPELDSKIEKAEAKAKASSASEADKKAAATAYFARADFYRDQGSPQLYKYALADYRRGLRYDPSDKEARAKMDEIVRIYESMGRPVPELGNEP